MPVRPPRVPRPVVFIAVVAALLSFVPLALIARARSMTSDQPRVQISRHMAKQQKFKPQAPNLLFADSRAERPDVPGTVKHTSDPLDGDPAFTTGRVGEKWVDDVPVPVTEAFVRRGEERFNIYCTPCHGYAGNGDGMIAKRADALAEGTWVPPSNLASAQILARPNGHIFNTITNGIRTMPSYAAQIEIRDRWAIVTYVRALQRAQNARPADAGDRAALTLEGAKRP